MEYSELSDQEKRIWDQVYAASYSKDPNAYYAIQDADQSIHDLRNEIKITKKMRR